MRNKHGVMKHPVLQTVSRGIERNRGAFVGHLILCKTTEGLPGQTLKARKGCNNGYGTIAFSQI